MKSLSRGKRASGDLIPWTISQQFADSNFASLSGARVVRIAVHPDLQVHGLVPPYDCMWYGIWSVPQGMGYGSRALSLLHDYYCGKITSLNEGAEPVAQATPTTHTDKVMQ